MFRLLALVIGRIQRGIEERMAHPLKARLTHCIQMVMR